jgi:hypothetical protein
VRASVEEGRAAFVVAGVEARAVEAEEGEGGRVRLVALLGLERVEVDQLHK